MPCRAWYKDVGQNKCRPIVRNANITITINSVRRHLTYVQQLTHVAKAENYRKEKLH